MKVLKIIGIAFLAIIVIYLVLCLIGPKTFEVSRTTTINAEKAAVFEQVADLKNWDNWSPWHAKFEDMNITYGEITRGLGANYSWTGDDSGEGTIETVEFEEGSMIKNKLDFGFWGTSYTNWKFEETEEGTAATWGMSGENKFILRGMALFMNFEDAIGKDFDEGLTMLKEYVESDDSGSNDSSASSYTDPEIVEREALTCLCIADTSTEEDLANFFTQAFTQIGIHMGTNKLDMSAQPLAIYYGPWDPTNIPLKACIPVSGDAVGTDKIEIVNMPAGEYVLTHYYGDYYDMEGAHGSIEAYMTENELDHLGWCFEQYITDPMTEPDPANWQTDIAYPIAQ